MAQWAKRPPLRLEVPGSHPRRWFNGPSRAGTRDPFRWLETARGLEPIRLIGRAQYFPVGLAASSLKRVSISHPFAVSATKDSVFFCRQPTTRFAPSQRIYLLNNIRYGRCLLQRTLGTEHSVVEEQTNTTTVMTPANFSYDNDHKLRRAQFEADERLGGR